MNNETQQLGQKRSIDVEKQHELGDHDSVVERTLNLQTGQDGKLSKRLLRYGIETRGIHPVPVEQRTDPQFSKIFFIWFTANFNILSFSAGTLGPVVFGLSLRDSCLVILFFNILCAIPPSYFTTWGPKLGLRQMVQARYTFGCVLRSISPTLSVLLIGSPGTTAS
jgi:cytosine/uracil/thiamine/allantoin permease